MELRRGNDAEIWYHGSNRTFALLREGSTVTRNRPLAEAFSHKPPLLSCEEDGVILHNGRKKGYLYVVDEPVCAEEYLLPHPRTTLAPGGARGGETPTERAREKPRLTNCRWVNWAGYTPGARLCVSQENRIGKERFEWRRIIKPFPRYFQ